MVEKKSYHAGAPEGERSYLPNLPRKERLSNKQKAAGIYKNPARITFTIKSIRILSVPSDNWAIAINVKKSVGSAVRRNYIKRKIRECYRLTKPLFTTAFSVIFQVNQDPDVHELNDLQERFYAGLNP